MHFYLRQWDYIFPGHPSMRCCFRWIPPLPGPMSVPAPIMWPPSPSPEYCIPPVSEYVASPNYSAGASSSLSLFFSFWQNLLQTSAVRKKPVDLPADASTFFFLQCIEFARSCGHKIEEVKDIFCVAKCRRHTHLYLKCTNCLQCCRCMLFFSHS